MEYIKLSLVTFLFSAVLFIHCLNPFFPKTAPYIKPYLAKPGAVIEELWASYQNQDFGRFDALFYDKDDFKFLINPNATVEYKLNHFDKNYSVPDSLKYFLPHDNYFYLSYSDERKIHNALFKPSVTINTNNNQLYYREEYIIPDTVTDPASYKPVEAIVYTEPVIIVIKSNVLLEEFEDNEVSFKIKEQKFLVRKNDEDQWKMRYWLELD
jgi:hypothetical protein